MLRGRAVVATQSAVQPSGLSMDTTGLSALPQRLASLTDSLREAWRERLRWREMGEAAAVRAQALYRPNDFQKIVA